MSDAEARCTPSLWANESDQLKLLLSARIMNDALKRDPVFAASWYRNLARMAQEEGLEQESAQRLAKRFMLRAFGVEYVGER